MPFAPALTDELRRFFYIGGMPEIVASFSRSHDYEEARRLQESLLEHFRIDFSKHIAPTDIPRVGLVWDSVPAHLSREKKKFIFRDLKIDKAYYWGDAGGRFEVDFVFERDARIVAAEVKAWTSVVSRSFVHFLARHETNVTGLRFSLLPHRAETHLVNIPLWAVASMP